MRQKATLVLVVCGILAGIGFLLRPASSEPKKITLTFNGYSADGTKAVFGITNHTAHLMAGGRPGIEYLTAGGWTNYFDDEILMVAHAQMLHSGDGWSDERKLPVGHSRWRAHVYYRLYPEDKPATGLTRLVALVRWKLGLGTTSTPSVSNKLQVVYTESMLPPYFISPSQ